MISIKPVLCAACGAVLSYYCLFPSYRSGAISIDTLLVLIFIPVAFLCLLRVLASFVKLRPRVAAEELLEQTANMPLESQGINSYSAEGTGESQKAAVTF